jgi:hypothetical protein
VYVWCGVRGVDRLSSFIYCLYTFRSPVCGRKIYPATVGREKEESEKAEREAEKRKKERENDGAGKKE